VKAFIRGRARARCGNGEDDEVIIECLDDMRAVIPEFAHVTLASIANIDFGIDTVKCTQWLDSRKSGLMSSALKERPFGWTRR
jgi:hypothetical protein